MIPENIIEDFRAKIQNSQRSMVFFHDDADGLCAYLQFLKMAPGIVKGVMLKTRPQLSKSYAEMIKEFAPDRVFVFDIALLEDELLESVSIPVTWLDHHDILQNKNIDYVNPKCFEPADNLPVSYWMYEIVKKDPWLAMVGSIADGMLAPVERELLMKYPEFEITQNEFEEKRLNYLYHSKVGIIYRLINNLLKGTGEEIFASIQVLKEINNPLDLLDTNGPLSKYLQDKNLEVEKEFDILKNKLETLNYNRKLVSFIYETSGLSFTKEIANLLCHKYPQKLVIVGRKKHGLIKMSLRWDKDIRPVLKKALHGLDNAWGGGHSFACGACVKEEDYNLFEERLFDQLLKNF